MAFSFRKMFNMNLFKKTDSENGDNDSDTHDQMLSLHDEVYEALETDPSCLQGNSTLMIQPETPQTIPPSSNSSPDYDTPSKHKHCKKLKIDIEKANQSKQSIENYVENTPKQHLFDSQSVQDFSKRLKEMELAKSIEWLSDDQLDVMSMSDHSETESIDSENSDIKMCRKVDDEENQLELFRPLSAGLFEEDGHLNEMNIDPNEDRRLNLLLSYQMKIEKMDRLLKKLLTEFQFHVDVSKVFHSKSIMTALPGSNVRNLPKILGEITNLDAISRGPSPTGSWNIVIEKEDALTKHKIKKQLITMKEYIEEFVSVYLDNNSTEKELSTADIIQKTRRFLKKHSNKPKKLRISNKKKLRRQNDFPDLKDAMTNLFSEYNIEETPPKCCYCQSNDSGNSEEIDMSQTISSSIGNFTLDASLLTVYTETLDNSISYSSFDTSTLYHNILEKATMERITFYVQVHSIQIKHEADVETLKINFYCPSCKTTESDEQELIKHILDQSHCEKIHFLYKTSYIKKCLSTGKEIQPSTILNPMTMYRDDNKIVCFGDAMYACTLCFENLIIGESILMNHCSTSDHVDKREKLMEIFEEE